MDSPSGAIPDGGWGTDLLGSSRRVVAGAAPIRKAASWGSWSRMGKLLQVGVALSRQPCRWHRQQVASVYIEQKVVR